MMKLTVLTALGALTLTAQQPCESLTRLTLPHTTVTSAELVAGTAAIPAHCDVKATTRPSSDSEIKFELWLPPSGWNGKYEQVGNGGWSGVIPVQAFGEPLKRGFAVAGTSDGHDAQVTPGAVWAIGHPEKLIDFGYRSVHETSLQSRAILQAFYGKDAGRSYFVGCSTGGRQALMEAQRYADDFDGIVAGAPANYWSHLITGSMWTERAVMIDPKSTIRPAQLKAVQRAALDQCDTLDGIKDGLIEDPRVCHFNPDVLLCKGAESDACLTAPQLEALKKIYAGPKNPRTGVQIFPGYPTSSEGDPSTWSRWILPSQRAGSAHSGFANNYFGQVVFEDPNFDFRSIDFDEAVAYADEKTGGIMNAINPDLRAFRDRGGKLIQYHGWGDSAIPATNSIQYYDRASAFMSKAPDERNSSREVHDFYRLFMVPGMGHCSGGEGPNTFGNRPGAPADADHDVVTALDRWVERGVAPEKIIGTGVSSLDKSKPMTRPLCAYPAVAKYDGKGDPNSASSFACAVPK